MSETARPTPAGIADFAAVMSVGFGKRIQNPSKYPAKGLAKSQTMDTLGQSSNSRW